MNINKAYETMEKGNKITHTYFDNDEYLYLDNKGIIRDEKGYDFEYGWELRIVDKVFANGWSIKEG